MKRLSITLFIALFCVSNIPAQNNRNFGVFSVAFYNLENLFDYEDDPNNPGDDDFTPTGAYNWTPAKYERKLDNLARVISRLGREHTPMGPAIIGVAEVENRRVLEDLVARPAIENMGLSIVHKDSRDRRGIDVAFLYNPRLFTLDNYRLQPVEDPENPRWVTREIMVMSGSLAGERVHTMVAHWPSRRGGLSSDRLRELAAKAVIQVIDSISAIEPNPKIIFMGDLNDDPGDRSISVVLNAKRNQRDVEQGGLFNPYWNIHAQGIGTLVFQGRWNLFDQIMVSYPFLGDDFSSLKFWRAEVFNRDFLVQQTGRNRGVPHRSFEGNTWIDGYSDHFPVLIYLLREI
jgi:endonuclease/exonuclease/phosphatase family metal-dependent hydrolase